MNTPVTFLQLSCTTQLHLILHVHARYQIVRRWYVVYRSLWSDKKDGGTKSEQTPGQQVRCNSLKTNVKMIHENVCISDQFISGREVGCPACLSLGDLTNIEKGM